MDRNFAEALKLVLSHVEPEPAFATLDVGDGHEADTEVLGDRRIGSAVVENETSLIRRQLRKVTSFASVVRPVSDLIGLVCGGRLPREMATTNAAEMPVAARVGRFMPRRWRLAMCHLAYHSGNDGAASFEADASVSVSCRIWPDKAVRAFVCSGDFKKGVRLAIRRPAREGIAMSEPSFVVRIAPASLFGSLAAIWNRAYAWGSHPDTSSVLAWLERVVVLPAPGAFAFCTPFQRKNQLNQRNGVAQWT